MDNSVNSACRTAPPAAPRHPWPIGLGLLALVLVLGCPAAPQTTQDAAQQDDAQQDGAQQDDAPKTPSETDGTRTGISALATWLDPGASAASFSQGDRGMAGMDPAVVAAIFALPPRAAELLTAERQLAQGFASTVGDENAAALLGPQSLVFRSSLGSGFHILRPLLRPKEEFEGILKDEGLHAQTIEGFDIYRPTGAFAWKIVVLDAAVVGFIPVQEMGSGLAPLTAGRDLPTSDMERELTKFIQDDPQVLLALHAAGPMLHYDVEAKIATTQFAWRSEGHNMVGQVVLAPMGDVDETANALEARRHPEENQQVQDLMSRVAFAREANAVLGRLELTPTDLKHLAR